MSHILTMGIPAREILTPQDIDAFPEDGNRYELLEGELLMGPAPFLRHQNIVMNIAYAIKSHLRSGRLRGHVFPAPVKVVLSNFTRFEPDVVFVSEKNTPILKIDGIYGAPDLVVEVLSSDAQRDRQIKLPAHLDYGVKEVWLVDGEINSVEVFTQKGEAAVSISEANAKSFISPTIPELTVELAELFLP